METIPPFVIHKAPEIDKAWATALVKHNKLPVTTKIVESKNRFKSFISSFVIRSHDPTIKRFDIGRNFGWQEVQQEIDSAVEAYQKQGRTWRHPLRSTGRSISNNASNLEVLLNFVPNGEHTFILCGALSLVFNAAKRIANVREKILECLGSLTDLVPGTKSYVEIYDRDDELFIAAEELYVGILEGVEGMLEWLDENAYKKTFQAVFKQNAYGRQLKENIKHGIEDKATHFRDRFGMLLHLRAKNIETIVLNTSQSVHTLVKLCQGLVKAAEWNHAAVAQLSRVPSPLPIIVFPQGPVLPSTPFIDARELQILLQVNTETTSHDIDIAFCEGQSMNPQKQARAAVLMQDERFQYWLKSVQSISLVVNGMESCGDQSVISPISYFAALLSQALCKSGTALPFTFFCGQHASWGDPLEGAAGMMRSLISQLLAAYGNTLDMSFINHGFIEAVRGQDIAYLCELFRGLITSVKQKTIFCILDGVSWFESSSQVQDLGMAMTFLRTMADEVNIHGGSLIFKLLVTSPSASQHAQDWFPLDSIIFLREEVEGDGYGFNATRMLEATESI